MKRLLNKITTAAATLPAVLVGVSSAFAASPWKPDTETFGSLDSFVQNALTVAVVVAAIIAIVFLIVNGIKYITSAGESSKTEEAQKGIIAALIGLIVVGVAYLIVRFVVMRVLGVDDLGGLDT
jgi:amino acid transporter